MPTIKAPQAVRLAGPLSDLDFERVITKVVAGHATTDTDIRCRYSFESPANRAVSWSPSKILKSGMADLPLEVDRNSL
jgi:hypothetical protein